MLNSRAEEAYVSCLNYLNQIEGNENNFNDAWLEGVLCLCSCWLKLDNITIINSIDIQKRIERAMELAFAKNNMEIVFILLHTGIQVKSICEEEDMPHIL